ncbi:hypothetical protein [Actinokineospora pegani]|uniref:hypothetical protein n=1 Tax=Actinokineospora pegani TaxID=2654637 RepID=UPI0012EA5827|nr:hypothetical protein [Actinokineospora pegani]
MTRRVPLPGADELFRSTVPISAHRRMPEPPSVPALFDAPPAAERPPRGTPRQKHTAKITVYVSDEELLALEQARLALRAEHGVAVDRGRVVREAVAVLLADLEQHGDESVLVQRLRRDEGR